MTSSALRPDPSSRRSGRSASRWSPARRALADLVGLVLSVDCAGCGRPDVALCDRCRAVLDGPGPRVRLTAWPDAPPARAGTTYQGPARRIVVAWKDRGRSDLTGPLAGGLARAVLAVPAVDPRASSTPSRARSAGPTRGTDTAVGGVSPPPLPVYGERPGDLPERLRSVILVPVPTGSAARRRRGGHPVGDLARGAARQVRRVGAEVRVLPALRLVRPVADQSRLDREQRRANLAGAMRVRGSARAAVAGGRCVIVDDVLTTGVTVREAARALGDAGAVTVGVAACCATPLAGGLSGDPGLH